MFSIVEFIELIKSRPVVALTIGLLLLLGVLYNAYNKLQEINTQKTNEVVMTLEKRINDLSVDLKQCHQRDSSSRVELNKTLNDIIKKQDEQIKEYTQIQNLTHKTIKQNENILDNN